MRLTSLTLAAYREGVVTDDDCSIFLSWLDWESLDLLPSTMDDYDLLQ